jgi:hypothetical protein
MARVDVYLEVGAKKVCACALDWPGYVRSGKTEEAALDALASYADRYRQVASDLPKSVELHVVGRVKGNATTDFGAPGVPRDEDADQFDGKERQKHLEVLQAIWTTLDKVAAAAPQALRKGPRGGGRDRDKVLEHVFGAETGYARQLDLKLTQPGVGDKKAIAEHRAALIDGIREPKRDDAKAWPPRYALRRIAWHALDHLWEIEDRAQ